MKNRRNVNAPPTADLVQYYIDSAYDNVKLVADNLTALLSIAALIDSGDFTDLLQATDIDTFAELNTLVADEELVTKAYVDALVAAAEAGLYDHKGSYDAATNTPDLDTAPSGIELADAYTVSVGGTFFGETVEAGDLLIANQDDPVDVGDWTIVNRNIDSSAFATAAQGVLADSALQPGEAATPAQGTLADSAVQPGDNISTLTNDSGFTDDQTNEEIKTAYNTATPVVSQVDAEAGTSTTAERWTPERVAQAITALGGGGGGGGGMTALYKTANYTASADELVYSAAGLTHTLPATPTGGDKVSFWDASDDAGNNAITIARNGETIFGVADDFSLNMNGGRVDFMFDSVTDTWIYSYVVQTIQPDATVTKTDSLIIYPKDMPYGSATDSASGDTSTFLTVVGPSKTFTAASWMVMYGVVKPQATFDGGLFRFRYTYLPQSTNVGTVLFFLFGQFLSDGDVLPAFPGSSDSVEDTTQGTVDKLQTSPWSNWTDFDGIPSEDAALFLKFMRSGVDTFTGATEVLYVELEWQYEETLTAAVSNNPNTVSRNMTSVSDTLLTTDAGKVIYASNAAAQDLGIPDDLPVGFQFILAWEGVGTPSVSMDGLESIVGDTAPAAQYKRLHVEKRDATTWWGTA